jgi:proteasome lid subunit RPN8/RPN11
MPFWAAGRRRKGQANVPPVEPLRLPPRSVLTAVRVTTASVRETRSFGRRDVDFRYDRVFIPSLIIDHTELGLRQAGVHGDEGFAIWAGTLSGGDAHVATLVMPSASGGPTRGEISAHTTAHVLMALDERDLVPVVQLHSHPRNAFLSDVDVIRPLVAIPGFISIVVPNFGFVDLADVALWSAHEYGSPERWRELDSNERQRRFIIDDSVVRVD